MNSHDLEIGDWIKLRCTIYEFYIIDNDETNITFRSPSWDNDDSMTMTHDYLRMPDRFTYLGKSKLNPFYNNITKLLKRVHPVIRQ